MEAAELKNIKEKLDSGSENPRDLKKYLGRTLVRMYHGEGEVDASEKAFENLFVKKDIPDDIAEVKVSESEMRIDDLMVLTKTADSNSAARRLVQGGGVSVYGEKISDPFSEIKIAGETVLKVGKRTFIRLMK